MSRIFVAIKNIGDAVLKIVQAIWCSQKVMMLHCLYDLGKELRWRNLRALNVERIF